MIDEDEVLGENPPQRHFVHYKIPHDRPGLEPRTAAVGSQRLTAWAIARPYNTGYLQSVGHVGLNPPVLKRLTTSVRARMPIWCHN
jgi:hypothetical protein